VMRFHRASSVSQPEPDATHRPDQQVPGRCVHGSPICSRLAVHFIAQLTEVHIARSLRRYWQINISSVALVVFAVLQALKMLGRATA